ncbi:MAG: extracellular solute-binding protein family 3 [Marmoricola sp.]|jgi:polar amino acid transport system substrate-binding protein|nr:extracellular solute-binding protein family 3 [Marmoricola sp.]
MTTTRVLKALALSGAVALSVTACGNTNDSKDNGATTTTTTKVDKALAAKVPASVAADGVISVGSDASYAPSEFLAADNKTVQGFDVDLFKAVAGTLGLKATFANAKFDSLIPAVGSGKYEVGVSSFTVNADRMKVANMISYFSAGTQWFTKKGNPNKVDPANACGMKIAVQTGTVQLDDLNVRSKACKDAGNPAITIDSYQGQDQATAAIVSGKDAAGLADSPVGAYAVQKTNGQLELLGDIYDSAPYGYVVPKDQTALAQAISGAVNDLIQDGSYAKILKKWGVDQGAITSSAVNPAAG